MTLVAGSAASLSESAGRAAGGCFGVDVSVPVPVDEILRRSGHNKSGYFRELYARFVRNATHMFARGGAKALDASCFHSAGQVIVVFLGDSVLRQSYQTWERAGLGGRLVYSEWQCRDSLARAFGSVFKRFKLSSTKRILLWAGCYIHSFFSGGQKWHSPPARTSMLKESFRDLQRAHPNLRIVWVGPSLVDLPIMRASPAKPDLERFEASKLTELAPSFVDLDRAVATSSNVTFLDRYEIDLHFRGLNCDGIHTIPHKATNSRSWGCSGFRGVEELVIQKGLYASGACAARAPFRLCT